MLVKMPEKTTSIPVRKRASARTEPGAGPVPEDAEPDEAAGGGR
ncbi:MAG: hypothetical protein XE10_1089 [Methanoculleus marisnigri]|uniref:Uncharacterized protein n=1 Tax=Methanoculleus marisnigri TaxID=2198 RepID=A0A101ITU8_9EURY|nr:hypothetical protein [Methanoculleus marisnigri]KUL01271.1 MAG: hypothetical protein XE10_1089 [Methanoculleus marisnigri]